MCTRLRVVVSDVWMPVRGDCGRVPRARVTHKHHILCSLSPHAHNVPTKQEIMFCALSSHTHIHYFSHQTRRLSRSRSRGFSWSASLCSARTPGAYSSHSSSSSRYSFLPRAPPPVCICLCVYCMFSLFSFCRIHGNGLKVLLETKHLPVFLSLPPRFSALSLGVFAESRAHIWAPGAHTYTPTHTHSHLPPLSFSAFLMHACLHSHHSLARSCEGCLERQRRPKGH